MGLIFEGGLREILKVAIEKFKSLAEKIENTLIFKKFRRIIKKFDRNIDLDLKRGVALSFLKSRS